MLLEDYSLLMLLRLHSLGMKFNGSVHSKKVKLKMALIETLNNQMIPPMMLLTRKSDNVFSFQPNLLLVDVPPLSLLEEALFITDYSLKSLIIIFGTSSV